MLWLELGKEVLKLGAPLLGAVLSGTPAESVVAPVCQAFGYDKQPVDPTELKNTIANDPNAFDKLQQVQTGNHDALVNAAGTAAISIVNKLI